MAAYTFPSAPVLVEATGEFAIGATGVLRAVSGGLAVQVYDLNDSPISTVLVGPKGGHAPFKADIPYGVLDFGSTQLVAVSAEALNAAIDVSVVADQARTDAQVALAKVNELSNGGVPTTGLIVINSGANPPANTPDGTIVFEI